MPVLAQNLQSQTCRTVQVYTHRVDRTQKSQKPPKISVHFRLASALNLAHACGFDAKSQTQKALELQRWPSAQTPATWRFQRRSLPELSRAVLQLVGVFITRAQSIPSRRTRTSPNPTPRPPAAAAARSKHGAPEQPPAPRRRRRPGRGCGRRGAAVVRAHRVPGVRGGGQRQRVRDPALHGRHVGLHRPHRRHLLRRRHAHRLPPAVQVHPGQERIQRDDRDDGAGADGGITKRRALLRLRLRRQLLRASQEPGRPAAGRGPARADVGRGPVRRRAPVRGLRVRRRRRRAGRAARRQPPGHQVGRRRQRRPQRRPGHVVHRGPV